MSVLEVFEPDSAVLNKGTSGLKGRDFDNINVAFLGGSVTYGYQPKAENNFCENNYTVLVAEHIEKIFKSKVNVKNLGISGTGSLMGLALTKRELVEFQPDIVFVEYAINDERSALAAAQFEGLIRNLLSLEASPIVIVIALFNKSGYSCEDIMLQTAMRYGLYFCGLKSVVYPLVCGSEELWHEYSNDDGHPNESGHRIIAECANAAVDTALKTNFNPMLLKALPKAIFGGDIYDGFDELTKLSNTNGFEPCSESFHKIKCPLFSKDNAVMSLKIKCRTLCVCYICTNNADAGSAEIFTDGKKRSVLQGYSIFGWNNPVIKEILNEDCEELHNIEIKTCGKFYLAGIWAN
ncbi:MAG: SGNH/GDSL hydrolase family protein [Ruminococcus sp.]|nr:SGNH/GDSL hydrolase family protein [Ruminococcus sp.]